MPMSSGSSFQNERCLRPGPGPDGGVSVGGGGPPGPRTADRVPPAPPHRAVPARRVALLAVALPGMAARYRRTLREARVGLRGAPALSAERHLCDRGSAGPGHRPAPRRARHIRRFGDRPSACADPQGAPARPPSRARRIQTVRRPPGPPHPLLTRDRRLRRIRRRPTTPITSGSSAGVGSRVDPWPLLAVLHPSGRTQRRSCPPPSAGTEAKVPGSCSRRQWPTGQAMTKALPTTRSQRDRAAAGLVHVVARVGGVRAVVAHHPEPALGYVDAEVQSLSGGLPGKTYGSSSGLPLTMIRPWVSQHSTVSPPTPMTRLIRSCSFEDGQQADEGEELLDLLDDHRVGVLRLARPASRRGP